MLDQEELKQLQLRRFVVGWELSKVQPGRTIVFVYCKLSKKIVYKINTADRYKAYPYIQEYYGEDDCIFVGNKYPVSYYE